MRGSCKIPISISIPINTFISSVEISHWHTDDWKIGSKHNGLSLLPANPKLIRELYTK